MNNNNDNNVAYIFLSLYKINLIRNNIEDPAFLGWVFTVAKVAQCDFDQPNGVNYTNKLTLPENSIITLTSALTILGKLFKIHGPMATPQVIGFNFPDVKMLFSFYSGDPPNTGGVFMK